ncbi:hypothetical protein HHK36_031743 [Tetracentron sinense]|uniref:Shugoshin C-terminal domain-containing protein n=1 Tax=Tetracentron sinense TaxID=13715 RepID=A0A834Y6E1_TETSI|nr:hypothetical protein HHK36_031743 [Tetracentron sinense]
MEGFFVLGSEDCGVGDKKKREKMANGSSLGSVVRKKLSDITNLQQLPKSPKRDEKQQPVLSTAKDYIDQLHKENMALMKLLAERNKIIELSGLELQKLRINLQKMQQQNCHLAQANSQMLAELNLGKDRLKALHHELGCKEALLKGKNLELEEITKKKASQETGKERRAKCEKEAGESLQAANDDNKPCNPSRKRQSRNQSICPSTVIQHVAAKEIVDNKSFFFPNNPEKNYVCTFSVLNRPCLRRQSARFKSEQTETSEDLFEIEQKEIVDNKRPCLRRQSARFKSEQTEPTEDLFEIEDAKFPARPLHDSPMHEDGPASLGLSTRKEEKEGNATPRCETQELRRSSIGRPLRRAAEKVQSYKEIPLNIKMRRSG